MRRKLLPLLVIPALVSSYLALPSTTGRADVGIARRAGEGRLHAAVMRMGSVTRTLPTISGGLQSSAAAEIRAEEADAQSGQGPDVIQVSHATLGCGERDSGRNSRVNQDCTFRRQAEESVAFNPTDPRNLIAGQNDSRIGYNHCGFDYSLDAGKNWGDGIPPFWQHINDPTGNGGHTVAGGPGTGHTYDFASDPAVAFDSRGNAFFSCVVLDINSNASGVLVTRSPAGAEGSFYNNVPGVGPNYVVAEDNSLAASHDKEFITADSYANSPYRDNVYVTWTVFNFTCAVSPANPSGYCSSAIYFSRSTDHAVTWSKPMEISGSSASLCFFGNAFDPTANPNACNFDQGSDPKVLPNGDIVVVFNNGNTAANNPNSQQLAVISHDGGATFSAPVKVGDDVTVGEPTCDFGRNCIPGAYIRNDDFPRIAVDRADTNGTVFATWNDYRNGEYDIILSESSNGGKTWHEAAKPVNPDTGADHYQAAADVSVVSDKTAIGYYSTGRVPNENAIAPTSPFTPGVQAGVDAESSIYRVSGGRDLVTPYRAVTVSPSFAPPDGVQIGFNGDYSGMAVTGNTANPVWSDTRNTAVTNQGVIHDEDVFTDQVPIP